MAISCGIKLTHDGAVALLDGERLVACHEAEKHGNAPRYSELADLGFVLDVLAAEGMEAGDVGLVVIDGWRRSALPLVRRSADGRAVAIDVAPYGDERESGVMLPSTFTATLGPSLPGRYASCTHVAGHLAASYCTSPFAARGEDAYVVVWDGGTPPRLFHVRFGHRQPEPVGTLGNVLGSAYSIFPLYFEPFRVHAAQLAARQVTSRDIGIAGKAMAYAGLGEARADLVALVRQLIDDAPAGGSWDYSFELAERFLKSAPNATPADAIASFDQGLGDAFIGNLIAAVRSHGAGRPANLCLAGGCGLNLRWNTRLRESGRFQHWVPPFTNDSGSALGAVAAERMSRNGAFALDWDVYQGPRLRSEPIASERWARRPLGPEQLGGLLHATGEPVVVLNGRAELGPRALGNRSILCAPHADAKALLNRLKARESYRPVAPICLEGHASKVFSPGCADPYMLFNHRVRPGWASRVPAVVHVDGTSRLQTVDGRQNPTVSRILDGFFAASGIPVLCNTSANDAGRGFFPDVASALTWGRARYVWSDGFLYEQVSYGGPQHHADQ